MRMTAFFALLLASPAAAQETVAPADPCHPEKHPYDAVAAAPYSHNVLFEDAHVRVLEIVLPPLGVEPIHIHMLPSVIMGETGGEGAKFLYTTYRYEGGKFVVDERQEITPGGGFRTVWSAPEGPHAIANIGSAPVRFTRTEIKPEKCAR